MPACTQACMGTLPDGHARLQHRVHGPGRPAHGAATGPSTKRRRASPGTAVGGRGRVPAAVAGMAVGRRRAAGGAMAVSVALVGSLGFLRRGVWVAAAGRAARAARQRAAGGPRALLRRGLARRAAAVPSCTAQGCGSRGRAGRSAPHGARRARARSSAGARSPGAPAWSARARRAAAWARPPARPRSLRSRPPFGEQHKRLTCDSMLSSSEVAVAVMRGECIVRSLCARFETASDVPQHLQSARQSAGYAPRRLAQAVNMGTDEKSCCCRISFWQVLHLAPSRVPGPATWLGVQPLVAGHAASIQQRTPAHSLHGA